MATKKIIGKDKKNFKQAKISEITDQLTTALQHLKTDLGEKKFDKRIRKAAKLLAEGVKEVAAKKIPVKGKPAKVIVKSPVTPAKKTIRECKINCVKS